MVKSISEPLHDIKETLEDSAKDRKFGLSHFATYPHFIILKPLEH
jgi:hypothetical protein